MPHPGWLVGKNAKHFDRLPPWMAGFFPFYMYLATLFYTTARFLYIYAFTIHMRCPYCGKEVEAKELNTTCAGEENEVRCYCEKCKRELKAE
jgi:hypothetical protein